MKNSSPDDRIAALERHAHAVTNALTTTVEHLRAVTAVSAAAMATLDGPQRETIREAALVAIGEGPQHEFARSVVEAMLKEAVAAAVDRHAGIPGHDLPPRLQ